RPRTLSPRGRGLRFRPLRTLRGRLIAGLVALLALGCATVGITTYIATRNSLFREVTTQVQNATGLWYECLTSQDGAGDGAIQGIHPWVGGRASGVRTQAGDNDVPNTSQNCGLGPGTLEATISDGRIVPHVVDQAPVKLTAADEAALRALPVTRMP